MVIANPIYDTVFKKLMQNTRIARFFIETVLEETVEDVELKPKGLVFDNKLTETEQLKVALAIVRFDFLATIKTASGEHKKVLIEIQKSRHPMDIVRFRNYLGLNYQVKDEVRWETGKKIVALPIVSIYLLGFKLPDIPTPIVKIARQYIDQISHKVINKTNDFIERLTHDCHIVQIPRIEEKLQTKLEQLLTIFEQKNFVNESGTIKEYKYPIENEYIKEMTDILNYAVADPETKERIDAEQEIYRIYNMGFEGYQEAVEELELKNQIIEQKDKDLEQKYKAIQELAKELEDLKQR